MTSLEIKRLDHVNGGVGGGSSKPNSPTKSTQQIQVKSMTTTLDNQAREVEIPISIIKSQSFTNNQELAAAAASSAGQLTPNKQQQQSSPGSNNRTLSNSNDNNTTDAVGDTSTNNKNRESLNRLSDYNISTTDMSDLRFNKYGFVDKTQTDDDKSTNGGRVGVGGTKTLKPSDAHSLNSSTNQAVTNLKDYLQNSDVEQFAEHLPIKVIQSREVKWMDMLNNYDSWMKNNFGKVKSRCRKGIPQSMRSRAWMYLTGAAFVKKANPTYYLECVENKNNYDITKYVEDIKKDLHRQFPSHELFMKEEGRQMLFNVLTAYAVHNREVGYCQAQGPIAALLLMHMPEEDSFWMLIRISDFYLKEYFKPGLEKVQIDGQALFCLFKKENEQAHKMMIKQGIDPVLYMTEWFMCIYARTLPWCTVLRVWDMFFCEGVKILYKVGLYLMMNAFGTRHIMHKCQQQGMYETLNCLKNLPIECLNEASLVRGVDKIDFSKKDFDKAFDKSREEFQKSSNSSRRSDAKSPVNNNNKAKKSKEKKK